MNEVRCARTCLVRSAFGASGFAAFRHCTVCGEPMPVPKLEVLFACSVGCKSKRDAEWATILSTGTEEYAMQTNMMQVVPPF